MRARAADQVLLLSDLPEDALHPWLARERARPFQRAARQVIRRSLHDALPLRPADPPLVITVATREQVSWLFEPGGALGHVPPPQPHQALFATAAQAGEPARVMQSLVAGDALSLQRALRVPARPRTDFLLLEDDLPRAYGTFDASHLPWQIGQRVSLEPTRLASEQVHATALGAAARDLSSLVARASFDLAQLHASEPMEIVYHPTLESLALATGRMELALLDDDGRVHVWCGAADLCRGPTEALWLTRGNHWSNGALRLGWQTYLAGDFYGEPWSFWAAWLAAARSAPSSRDLLQPDALSRWSPLFVAPLVATLIAGVAQHVAANALEATLAGFDGSCLRLPGGASADLATLDGWYFAELDQLVERHAGRMTARRSRSRQLPGFQKGFCFAHDGYNVVDGYGSELACTSLDAIKQLGGNAVSITPFGYQPDLDRPTLESFARFGRSAGGENDAAVIKACREAQARGMFVILKPHLWTSHGTWCGEIRMTSGADWDEFFTRYERFILHYALVAEMLGLDALAIGTELKGTTGPENAARWQAVLARSRGLFSGLITYAANWGDEAEHLPFARALDFLGVNAYWPLAQGTQATDAELCAGAERVARSIEHIARSCAKPVVFTEVGYPAVAACWQRPYAQDGERTDDDQARCYAALLGALKDCEWLRGIYVWKWPTTLRRGDRYCPNGRPAADAITRFFGAR